MFEANILPGEGFEEFVIWEMKGKVSDTGRAGGSYNPTEKKCLGILTTAKPKEIEQWQQKGHPVTHKITQFGTTTKAAETNYLVLAAGRQFYVQGIKNPGGLDVTRIYYVEERKDLRIGGAGNGK